MGSLVSSFADSFCFLAFFNQKFPNFFFESCLETRYSCKALILPSSFQEGIISEFCLYSFIVSIEGVSLKSLSIVTEFDSDCCFFCVLFVFLFLDM